MLPMERAARWRALGKKRFTAEEDMVVRNLAPTHSLKEIAEVLGRRSSSIQSACRRLGIATNGGNGGWPMQKRNRLPQEIA